MLHVSRAFGGTRQPSYGRTTGRDAAPVGCPATRDQPVYSSVSSQVLQTDSNEAPPHGENLFELRHFAVPVHAKRVLSTARQALRRREGSKRGERGTPATDQARYSAMSEANPELTGGPKAPRAPPFAHSWPTLRPDAAGWLVPAGLGFRRIVGRLLTPKTFGTPPAKQGVYPSLLRHRKKRSALKGRCVVLAVNLCQSIVSGLASAGITGFS